MPPAGARAGVSSAKLLVDASGSRRSGDTASVNWERWSWFFGAATAGALASSDPWLSDAIGIGRAIALYGMGGIAIGWSWYQLYPRPLADRLFPFACFFVIAILLPLLPGDIEIERSLAPVLYAGVLVGLVFNEKRSREAYGLTDPGAAALPPPRSTSSKPSGEAPEGPR